MQQKGNKIIFVKHHKKLSKSVKTSLNVGFVFALNWKINIGRCLEFKSHDSKYRNTAFTVERKENNSFSFLDTKFFAINLLGNYKLQFLECTHLVVFKSIPFKYNLISTLLQSGFMIGFCYRGLHDENSKLKHIF